MSTAAPLAFPSRFRPAHSARARPARLLAAVLALTLAVACSAPDEVEGEHSEVVSQTEEAATQEAAAQEAGTTASGDGEAVVRLPGQPVGFPSPFAYLGGIGYVQTSLVYDTLLWKDASGAYVPWLAEDHERSEDGTTYTFHLRDDVRWHDGEPLTPSDVVFTFEYLREHAEGIAPSVIARIPASLEEVRAPDHRTVELQMSQPDWTVEGFAFATGVFILPEHVWAEIDDPGQVRDLEVLVGSGPYLPAELEPDTGANLYLANEDYFLGKPAVSRIEFQPVDDELSALQGGATDQAGGVGPGTGLLPTAVEPFRGDDEYEVFDATGDTVTALYWNVSDDGPLSDLAFRQAVAHGIDRQRLVDQLFDGQALVGSPGLLPPTNPMHVEVEPYEYDPDLAERLLEDAGYLRDDDGRRTDAEGEPLRFELLISDQQPSAPVELVVADLEALGIGIDVRSVDLPTFHERRNQEDTELSINTFGGTNTDEQPDGMSKVYLSETGALQRAQGYGDERFDALHREQRGTLEEADRVELAEEMQQLAAEELPVLPLFYPPLTTVVRTTTFDGWYQTPGGVGGLVPSVNDKRAFILGDEADG